MSAFRFREIIATFELGRRSAAKQMHAENIIRLSALLANFADSSIRFFFFNQRGNLVDINDLSIARKSERIEANKLLKFATEICDRPIWVGNHFGDIGRFRRRGISKPELLVVSYNYGTSSFLIRQGDSTTISNEFLSIVRRPFATFGPKVKAINPDPSRTTNRLKILVPTSLTRSSRAAELYALSLAKRSRGHVTLFHCTWPAIKDAEGALDFTNRQGQSGQDFSKESHLSAERKLAERQQVYLRHGINCDIEVDVRPTRFSYLVSTKAHDDYSLIIMGRRNKNTPLALGSKVNETILYSAIPVVIV